VDRGQERISRGAFAGTIARWRLANRPVPLHWDHKAEPQFVVGRIEEMRETTEGLWVSGRLDLEESAVAREAWRAMKGGTVGLSFGYLVTKSHDEADVRVLDEVDLFEVSLTPSPMNADTRVLSMKSARLEPRRIASFEC
jgi:HK97 family phage prohead protease